MDNQPIIYRNQKDSHFYLCPEVAQQIGIDDNIGYVFDVEDKKLIFRPFPKEINTIYHYCSYDNMKKIISSKCLWLTHCLDANDSKEIIWAIDKLEEIYNLSLSHDEIYREWNKNQILSYMKKFLKNKKNIPLPSSSKYYKKNVDELFKKGRINIPLLKQILINFFNEVFGEVRKNILPTYISCFSTEKDRLSQWRGYGDDGHGVAIGFNPDALNELTSQGIFLRKVIYHEIHQNHIILDSLKNYIIDIDKEKTKRWAYEVLPTLKHPAFEEEQEYRLVMPITENVCLKAQFHSKNGEPRKHYELPLENNFITEIVLGPKCDKKNKEIIELFNSSGFIINENQIKKSTIPYV